MGKIGNKTEKARTRPAEPSRTVQATCQSGQVAPRPHAGFDAERAAYARLRPGLLETAPGRFVVLVGKELAGPFDDFRDAYLAGRRRFGPGPLYIKQVLAEEPVFEPVGLLIVRRAGGRPWSTSSGPRRMMTRPVKQY